MRPEYGRKLAWARRGRVARSSVSEVRFLFLDRAEVAALAPRGADLLRIVEQGLAAHALGEVVQPPKSHLPLDGRFNGHFNILPGYAGPVDMAGVKVIGDYVDNWRRALPSEIALLTLYDPRTGAPCCLMDATLLTWLRTGAVTAIGARHLARPDAAVVAHIGARGTALGNLELLAGLFPLREIRIASKRPETRERLAATVRERTGIDARPADSVRQAVEGADIVVEATRLERPEVLIEESWLAPGALLVTYGWVMALDPRLPPSVDKLVVDDWEQCGRGGQLSSLIQSGTLGRDRLHAEIGEIVCGRRPGRASADERILFWHRGFAVSDIMVGSAIYDSARRQRRGQWLTLWEGGEEG